MKFIALFDMNSLVAWKRGELHCIFSSLHRMFQFRNLGIWSTEFVWIPSGQPCQNPLKWKKISQSIHYCVWHFLNIEIKTN